MTGSADRPEVTIRVTGVLDRIGTGTPDWVMCAGCRTMVYGRRLSRNLLVCPDCGHHHRMGARERIAQLLDEDSVRILDTRVRSRDVLGFTDTRPYPARLAAAREATGLTACVLVARGTVGGYPLMAAVMDFNFLGGSLGGAAGELITRGAELSLRDRVPLLIASASGGARMQEGAVSLMQMAKTATALGRLDEAGILTISLITDPTYGGVAASFATLADVILNSPEEHGRIVNGFYAQFLNRGPDPAGEQAWLSALQNPTVTQSTIAEGFLASGRPSSCWSTG